MVIECNVLQSHPVEAGVPQDSLVSPILFAIHTAGQKMRVEERLEAAGLCFIYNLGRVATGKDVNKLVK